jgi:shikimate kinase/3-dehydroquinate synthase
VVAKTAIARHLALAGFMGAGKSTVGREVAELLERPFVDLDEELERAHGPIPELFAARGEPAFRALEEEALAAVLCRDDPCVVALGGGAVVSARSRERLAKRAFTVLVNVDLETAWERVQESGDRPLARDREAFARLYEERRAVYEEAGDAVATDAEGVLLACLGIHVERGALGRLGDLVPGDGPVALVGDEHVLGLHRPVLGARLASTHALPEGEAAKTIEAVSRLWAELRLDRGGRIVALGGGAATDAAGFAAATYLRGIAWTAVPTTLVGQVDAAIGGKTGIDLPGGKNLVGAFHLPERVVTDPDVLSTLPPARRREGMAEAVKTGLLAGRELWTLDDQAMVRGCAAFKAAVVVSDPLESGRRAILNLGHTFAHALETGAGHGSVGHGDAVALGLTAALRLSERHLGLDPRLREEVGRVLGPVPVAADRGAAWAALARDKKAVGGSPRLVLLAGFGAPVWGVELPADEVRAELDALIAP